MKHLIVHHIGASGSMWMCW